MLRHNDGIELYVGVLIENIDGRVAVQLRDDAPGVTNRGKLSLFGGRALSGEKPRLAAVRELLEETTLSVNEADLMLLSVIPYAVDPILSLAHVYVLRQVDTAELVILEGAGYRVYSSADLKHHPKATPLCRTAAMIHHEIFGTNLEANSDWLHDL